MLKKKSVNIWLCALLLLLHAAGCADMADGDLSAGQGRLSVGGMELRVEVDNLPATRAVAGTYPAPEASALTYTLTNQDTQESTQLTYDELLASPVLAVGSYTLTATYGAAQMGTTPYLYREFPFVIQPLTTTALGNLSIPLACAMIRPEVDDLLPHFQAGYTLTLTDNTAGSSLTVSNQTDYYVPMGHDYTLTLSGTNQLGEAKNLTNSITGAAAATRYLLQCTADLPVFTLPEQPDYNAWSYHIDFTPMTAANISYAAGLGTDRILNNMTYEVSADGGASWQSFTGTKLSGLNPNSTYKFRARFGAVYSTNQPSLTTEGAAPVPNGDFEDLVQTISVSEMKQGGEYRISPVNYQNTATFTLSEPSGWSSVNLKTCNNAAGNQNTWFVVPSTYATNISWSVYRDFGKKSRTPDVYTNLSAQSGYYAMILRNVAWDANGVTPSRSGGAFNTTYYCENIPSIANRSAGKLFIGTYTYSNGSETYDEGTSFSSRPLSLSGYYKYKDNQSGETATVKVTLLNGSTEIAAATVQLGAAASYTPFTLNIPYNDRQKKATQLKIMIASSNFASYTQSVETSSIVTTNYNGERESTSRGAELTIDNLTFTYD